MAERAPTLLGALVRQLRVARGLTQEELAARAPSGLSVKTIGNIERGRHRAQRHVIDELADALSLTSAERRAIVEAWQRTSSEHAHQVHGMPPQPLSSLVGRESEVEALKQILGATDARLLTLVGPAGVGKTRLAWYLAAEQKSRYPDGVNRIPLDGIDDPRMVFSAIGDALGVRESSEQPIDTALRAFLAHRSQLLVLDTFEHVLDAASRLVELLQACPTLRVLVTSQVPLRVRGERTFPVTPLLLPEGGERGVIAAAAAVRLFVERAREVVPDFALTDYNAGDVAAICVRLDGLPLAIELAVPWLRIWSPRMLRARLDQSLQVLVHGARDLPARQQTLRDALAWSYQLLGAEEQAIVNRLALFAGGWTIAAAAAICRGLVEGEADMWSSVARLSEKNFVQAREGIAGAPRFVMLETIREFGLERLEETAERHDVHRAHARYFLALAEREGGSLATPEQPVWNERLDRERDNFHVALAWARAHDATMALQLGTSLWRCWVGRGYVQQGCQWLATLLTRPEAQVRTVARARALLGLGSLWWALGDLPAASDAWAEAESIGREHSDALVVAATVVCQGMGAQGAGRFPEAGALYAESLDLAREGHDDGLTASVLERQGLLAAEAGDIRGAEQILEESLRLRRSLHDESAIARSLYALASLALGEGALDRARALGDESLRLRRCAGEPGSIAQSLAQLGALARAEGNPTTARARYEESAAILARIGDRRGRVRTLLALGALDREEANIPAALARVQEALALAEDASDRRLAVECRELLTRLLEPAAVPELSLARSQ